MNWKITTGALVGSGFFFLIFPLFVGEVTDVIRDNEVLYIIKNQIRQVGIYLERGDSLTFYVHVRGGGNDSPQNTIDLRIRDPDDGIHYLKDSDQNGYIAIDNNRTIELEAPEKGPYNFMFVNKGENIKKKSLSLTWLIETKKPISFITLNPDILWLLRGLGGIAVGSGIGYGIHKHREKKEETEEPHEEESSKSSNN